MLSFIEILKNRNETLFYFGLICLVLSMLFLVLTQTTNIQVMNVNAWYKPFKFAFSTMLYAWAMAWFCYELEDFNLKFFNWSIIILLGLEILYIAIQAARGQLSHFNLSTPIYSLLYSGMAIAATLVTIYTAYVALLFFQQSFPNLPDYYVWAIRLGLIIFVVFSFQGFLMGSRLTHTVGGADGTPGIPVVNWSKQHGDLRIAHFLGMHALQILPILAFYVVKNVRMVFMVSIVYTLVTIGVLIQALQGKPLWK